MRKLDNEQVDLIPLPTNIEGHHYPLVLEKN